MTNEEEIYLQKLQNIFPGLNFLRINPIGPKTYDSLEDCIFSNPDNIIINSSKFTRNSTPDNMVMEKILPEILN
jgi:hypothetical protein